MYSCSIFFFFGCRSFSPWWPLEFLLFLTAAIKFSCFSSNEIGLLCFPVIHVNVDIKINIKWKERIGFAVVVLISKRPGSHAIYRRNARVLEMQNFIPAYMKGRTYVRTFSVRTTFSEPKFLGCIDYQIFLPTAPRWAGFARSRAPPKKKTDFQQERIDGDSDFRFSASCKWL